MKDDKEIIEAEIVPTVDELALELSRPVPPAPPPPRKKTNTRTRTYTDAIRFDPAFQTYERHRVSDRERKFIALYVKSGSIKKACEEIGIHPSTGTQYLRRPWVLRYVEALRERAAKAADLTMDKIGAVFGAAVDGDKDVTPLQIQAATAAAKFLRPANPVGINTGHMNLTVNQQNNHFSGASPFTELDQTAMLEAIRQNLLEMGDGE